MSALRDQIAKKLKSLIEEHSKCEENKHFLIIKNQRLEIVHTEPELQLAEAVISTRCLYDESTINVLTTKTIKVCDYGKYTIQNL